MRLLMLVVMLALAGCSTSRQTPPAYAPPSSAQVRETVSSAKRQISAANDHARAASSAIARAEKEAQAEKPAVDRLRLDLATATIEIDALSADLLKANRSLDDSGRRLSELENQVEEQTSRLNTTILERNTAVTTADIAQATARRLRFALWKWRAAFVALVLAVLAFLFRRPLGALLGIPIP